MNPARLVALLVGVGLGWLSTAAPVAVPTPSVAPEATVVEAPTPQAPVVAQPCPPAPESPEALSLQLARQEAMLRFAQGQEELAVGRVLAWPETVPASHTEAGVRKALDVIDALEGVDVLGLDCVEYPCGFAIAVGEGAETDEVFDLYDELGWDHASTDSSAFQSDGRTLYVMRTVVPVDAIGDDLGRKRLSFRKAEMDALYASEVAELME